MSKKKYSATAAALRSNAVESLGRTTASRGRVTLSAIYAVAPGEEARSGGPCKIQYSLDDATSPRGFWEAQGYREFYGYAEVDIECTEYQAALKTTAAVLGERFGATSVVII